MSNRGRIDKAKVDATTDEENGRQIAEDQDSRPEFTGQLLASACWTRGPALTDEEIDTQIAEATARGEADHAAGMLGKSIRFDPARRVVVLERSNGEFLDVPLALLKEVANASDPELAAVEVSAFGIHFPALDADYSVKGVIQALAETTDT